LLSRGKKKAERHASIKREKKSRRQYVSILPGSESALVCQGEAGALMSDMIWKRDEGAARRREILERRKERIGPFSLTSVWEVRLGNFCLAS